MPLMWLVYSAYLHLFNLFNPIHQIQGCLSAISKPMLVACPGYLVASISNVFRGSRLRSEE